MSWREEYLPASFRGAPFFVRSSTVSCGRRLAIHQYPRRDDTEHEDLGAEDKSYTFDCYVIGDDYMSARDKLEKAFEEGTVGVLIHPYRNAINVVVDKYRLSETHDKGGAAFFSITFLHEPKPAVAVFPDNIQRVLLARDALDIAVANWFEAVYNIDRSPLSVLEDIRDAMDRAFSVIDKAKRAAATAAAFKRGVANARGQIIALRVSAGAIAFTFKGLIDYGIELGEAVSELFSAKDQLREQRQILSFTDEQIVDTSVDISQKSSYPTKQLQTLMAYNTVSSTLGLIPQVNFGSVTDAEEEQKLLFDTVDSLSEDPAVDDAVFSSLRDARETVYNYLQEESVRLPILVDYTPVQETNALVLSYAQYGNIDEAEDISDRNRLIHPGFIPKAKSLQLKVRSE